MALNLPPELTKLAEDHGCFSGCWSRPEESTVAVEPGRVETVFTVQCSDCLIYRVGATAAQLGGPPYATLGDDLSAHVHALRGYSLSFSGYHLVPNGNGFWLTASWLPLPGVFLLSAQRRAHVPDPVASLIEAFRLGVAVPPDNGMLVATNYRTHNVFVHASRHSILAPTVQALLVSSHFSPTRQPGFLPVTVAEYLPVASRAVAPAPARRRAAPAAGPVPVKAAPATRKIGDRCDVCGETVEERPLLISTYIGCACG